MSLVHCHRLPNRDADAGGNGDRTYRSVYDVTLTDPTESAYDVLLYVIGIIGDFGSEHPEDEYALLCQISPQQVSGTLHKWEVAVTWKTRYDWGEIGFDEEPGTSPGSSNPNPTLRPPVYSFQAVGVKKAVYEDMSDPPKLIVNTAGQPLIPPLEITRRLLSIKVSKNKAPSDLTTTYLRGYLETCNDATWIGLPTNSVKVISVSAVSQDIENKVAYYRVEWEFLYDSSLWRPTRVLNQGTWEKTSGETPTLKLIRDAFGTPLGYPVPLKEDGTRLEIGGTPFYLEFMLVPESDFSEIP